MSCVLARKTISSSCYRFASWNWGRKRWSFTFYIYALLNAVAATKNPINLIIIFVASCSPTNTNTCLIINSIFRHIIFGGKSTTTTKNRSP